MRHYRHYFFKLFLFQILSFFGIPEAISQNKSLPMTEDMYEIKDKKRLRKELYELLGKLPDRERPISVELVSTEEKDGVVIEKLLLDINGLISPRPHFGLAGKFDPLTPMEGLSIIDENLKKIYAKDGAPEAWKLKIYEVAHEETAEMRKDILQFLRAWL